MPPRFVRLSVLVLFALILGLATACGGDSDDVGAGDASSAAETGGTPPVVVPSPARVDVNGEPGEDRALEARSASRVFWSPLRNSALALAAVVEAGRIDPQSAAFLDYVEKRVRADVLGVRGLDPDRVASHLELGRVDLGEGSPRVAQLIDFQTVEGRQRWLAAAHPQSPSIEEGAMRSVSREEWADDKGAKKRILLTDAVPSLDELKRAADEGARAWCVRLSADDTVGEADRESPGITPDPAGFAGDLLPLPLFYVGNTTGRVVANRVASGGFGLRLHIRGADAPREPASALRLRVGDGKAAARVVVTVGRRDEIGGPGSECLAAARLIALARSFAIQVCDAKNPRDFAMDMEFVFVADHGLGFDFLASLPADGVLLGVVDLGTAIPAESDGNDVVVAMSGKEARLEKAALAAARAYARRVANAWNLVGFDRLPGPAVSNGAGRVPVVGLDIARVRERRRLKAPEGVEVMKGDLTFAPAAIQILGSPRDSIEEVARGKLLASVAQVRLGAITLVRLQAGL